MIRRILFGVYLFYIPFTIKSQSAEGLSVSDQRVGIGTLNPEGSLHIIEDNQDRDPEIYLESIGGAIPSKWKIGGRSNTGRLLFQNVGSGFNPLFLYPDAPDNSLVIQGGPRIAINHNAPESTLHLISQNPTTEHGIISQMNNSSSAYTSNWAALTARNSDMTDNNYVRLNFDDGSSAAAASIGAQITNHATDYGDLVFWTRGPGGFSEALRINQHNQLRTNEGSAAMPSYSFNNAGAMGMFKSGTNLAFTNQGQLRVQIEADGDLVINPIAAGNGRLTTFGLSADSKPTVLINNGGQNAASHALYVLARPAAGFSADVLRLAVNQGYNANYNFLQTIVDEDGTPSYPFTLRGDGNFGIQTNSFGTNAKGIIGIGNGTSPTSSPANMVQLFAEDNGTSSELKVRDEAGNVTTISPHNFSLIDKPSHEMAWSYYSEKDSIAINVDMFRVVQLLEELTGEKLIHIEKISE